MASSVFSAALLALPVGNFADATLYQNGVCTGPSKADPCDVRFKWCNIIRYRGGFYGDYVSNRHLDTWSNKDDIADISQTQLWTNAALGVINICDWIDLYTTIGTTTIAIETDGSAYSTDSTMIALRTNPKFSWSLGGRATLLRLGDFYLGTSAQYFKTNPHINSFTQFSSGRTNYFNSTRPLSYYEWQIALGVAYEALTPVAALTPYGGICRSGGQFLFNDLPFTFQGVNYTLRDLKPKKLWSYAIGVSAMVNQMIGITVEGRFAGEKALHVNGQCRF